MARFNIKEDLQDRKADQALEILAISGPTATKVMQSLIDNDYSFVENKFGLKICPAAASRIIAKYSRNILR